MYETFLKASYEAKLSELKVELEKIWDNFPQAEPVNRAVPSFRNRLKAFV